MPIAAAKKYCLGLVCLALVLVFSLVIYVQYRQTQFIGNTVQYDESDARWSLFQIGREVLRLRISLDDMLETQDPEAWDRLQLRYEIFLSRYRVLRDQPAAAELLASSQYTSVVNHLKRFSDQTRPYFETSSTMPDTKTLDRIRRLLDELRPELIDLSNLSARRSAEHSVARVETVKHQTKIGSLLILLQFALTLVFFYLVVRLIRQLQASHTDLHSLANFDLLTGLPNRRLLRDRLEQEIRKSERNNKRLALLFLDLDNFKDVNDSQGHDVGDALLRETAKRLERSVRKADTVGRLGGDEYTIILGDLDNTDRVAQVCEAILENLQPPFVYGDCKNFISASIGATIFPDDASDVNTLLKNADQAMYVAKAEGRNRYHYFTPSMQQAAQRRMSQINDLRDALEHDRFEVLYQPIVDLGTGAVRKAEALVRWEHPELGVVSPAEFIPIAEETGLIIEIGNRVFDKVTRQAVVWRDTFDGAFQISVNTSPVQLCAGGTDLDSWFGRMAELGLSGNSLAIEITESILMDTATADRLERIRGQGIQVSLDDFGTGYSSLSYLKKFNIDYLKMDKSFVQSLRTGTSDAALCEAIIVMAHRLGIRVIAEGIETEEQRDLLLAMECDYGQGYLFSRPVSAGRFEKLVQGVAEVDTSDS